MQSLSIEEFGLGDPRMREFVALPWRLYRGDPFWTPALDSDYLGSKLLGTKGLLTAEHPYHEHAEVTHFIARRDGRVVGRISSAINHRFNEFYGVGCKIGFFGFFEVENDYEVAAALLDSARDWGAAKGMTAMRGPGEYSNATHERQGTLIEGFDTPPTVDCTHNPPFYGEFLERWGLSKVKDYYAHVVNLDTVPADRLARLAAAVRKRNRIETRTVNMADFQAEVRKVIHIYNQAWAANWGFLPVTDDEADTVADMLKPIIDPGLIRFASIDGEEVAVLGAFPDPNWALRPRWGVLGDSDAVRIARLLVMRRHIPRVRLMFFGIAPEYRLRGIDALLFDETYRHSIAKGYKTFEASLLLENNDMVIRPTEFAGGTRYKTWRIYERAV